MPMVKIYISEYVYVYIAKPITKNNAKIIGLLILPGIFVFIKRRKIKLPKKAAGI